MRCLALCVLLSIASTGLADGPSDNIPENVRPVPPKGKPVPEADRTKLEASLAKLADAIAADPRSWLGACRSQRDLGCGT